MNKIILAVLFVSALPAIAAASDSDSATATEPADIQH
jgi:hypothetical protein